MKWGNHREQTIRRSRNWNRGCWIDNTSRQIRSFRFYRKRVLAIVCFNSGGTAPRSLFRTNGSFRRVDPGRDFDGCLGHSNDRQLVRVGIDEVHVAFVSIRSGRRTLRILRIRVQPFEANLDGGDGTGGSLRRSVRNDASMDLGDLPARGSAYRLRRLARDSSSKKLVIRKKSKSLVGFSKKSSV